jgi:hypothetical protein
MAVVVGLLYLVRRSIPQAGLLLDVGRANALYGMVCTAFAVLLAFVVFVGFQSFNQDRSEAELEALCVQGEIATGSIRPDEIREPDAP